MPLFNVHVQVSLNAGFTCVVYACENDSQLSERLALEKLCTTLFVVVTKCIYFLCNYTGCFCIRRLLMK